MYAIWNKAVFCLGGFGSVSVSILRIFLVIFMMSVSLLLIYI